ncbi:MULTISPECIES: D-serine/D-alanine/glycine transporter [unclassified Mycolicibacterium]|uniref:D-serine/D-alanine/glycine transporter n=1 Tax=unclassified Mycolicibacterium TaxID=2636767 RepID=UPI00130B16A6|nr:MULTISPECIES: D-serine/D-alanine/glycine transporter [unclassified Mycolicibacterium]MUL85492.1 D-serine/D-alanine/glycine transporter [Mycolicibacterium sp. CBMA 329]MUL88744.1 D-serine/D-alanine/glycine transporter [Mycolicibacterium sp. CBMA 331]MUM01962.1 D-serine/D-alanine/glycine transporter [Mycolicibacterium sp. CBMA 334]MUM29232.1 D-serine/D-alanine/glycine transporter [Mycolicibacterium sp. CBMA 295]MUM40391.1 D-serine/D-alanine/glycine transporter [Mycolicibacterium sp. CBMA 247]
MTAARGDASPPASTPPNTEQQLSRQLSNRHIQLIAIGGAIGTGLFMGSGKTISLAGPSVIFVYMTIGFMLFFVMRAMGELLLSNLHYKSFADFAADLLGPWAGFFTGWTYWFCWIVTGVADVVAISGYVRYWWGDIPLWIPALAAVVLLITLNLPTVKAFGETEFWFALIKIVAIVALIVVGLVMVFKHFHAPGGAVASFSNLWNDGGFFPTGPMGFVAGFQIATFAFVGIELVGTTAAEAKNPERNLPKAINSIPVRVMLFYVAALTIIIAVTPWREIVAERSPFVAMFSLAGLGIAASVINFVVLTSATSSANSGIYSTSRMIYGLAKEGDAPSVFGRLTSRHVPANALFLSGVFLMSGVVMVAVGDSIIEAFTVVTTISSLCFIFVWTIILISYLVYRRRRPQLHEASKFKMPGGIAMCYVVLAFFVFLVWAFTQKEDTLHALLVTPIWFVVLGVAWLVLRRRPGHLAREAAFRTDLEAADSD